MSESRILGVIPARAGSKGIKNKNIFKVGNKPLIEHTFHAATKSNIKLIKGNTYLVSRGK